MERKGQMGEAAQDKIMHYSIRRIDKNVGMHACAYAPMHVCMHARMDLYGYMYACMRVCTCVCMLM